LANLFERFACPIILHGFQRGMTDLSHLARSGATLAIRVTPNARRAGMELVDGQIRIAVTETPEAGKATEAARAALAKALGVAKTRLTLVRGAAARDKLFRLDD
jgi:uncharacterized protein YggU (UPF0235/DUF167 family)